MAFHGACLMVEFEFSDIKETKPLELGVRFLFGGICTVGAGSIAKRYGAGTGELFLAFSGECHPHPSPRKGKESPDGHGWHPSWSDVCKH
jgi:hypothetical protein